MTVHSKASPETHMRELKENQRDKYIRRFDMRRTDVAFVIRFDGKEFIRVRCDMAMPSTFAFKIAATALMYCIGRRSLVWDELAVEPLKDTQNMQRVAYGLKEARTSHRTPKLARSNDDEHIGHA